ncbi:hypothetical protein SDC9_200992 [bioreactor metagenome]|uniref:Ferrous iron transporter FeoA-like domain-containing protein n=1 Tax=bioreactor metagenome TaxID=1076179 RepID=A0A645IPQ5_9ZZZZ
MKTLNQLALGQRARVKKLTGRHNLKHKLADMGITPGTMIVLKRMAPMGDPIEINLRGYELSLRKTDAQMIVVEEEEK